MRLITSGKIRSFCKNTLVFLALLICVYTLCACGGHNNAAATNVKDTKPADKTETPKASVSVTPKASGVVASASVSTSATTSASVSASATDSASAAASASASTSATASASASAASQASPTPGKNASTVLKLGDTGPAVKEMQQRLMELGYLKPGIPTASFDNPTKLAIQLFQRQHYLMVTGVYNADTRAALFANGVLQYMLTAGMSGNDVATLQKRLAELGYYTGPVTGQYDDATTAAIKTFQQANGLTISGSVGADTLLTLYSDDVKAAK